MDNQFATEIILENGKALKFDDIGCMYKWMEINPGEKTKEKFVRDYDSKEWISLEDATYVYDKTITTPMAYNVISFENKKDAESFVSNYKGKVLSYKELAEHKWEMNKEMMGNTKKEITVGIINNRKRQLHKLSFSIITQVQIYKRCKIFEERLQWNIVT